MCLQYTKIPFTSVHQQGTLRGFHKIRSPESSKNHLLRGPMKFMNLLFQMIPSQVLVTLIPNRNSMQSSLKATYSASTGYIALLPPNHTSQSSQYHHQWTKRSFHLLFCLCLILKHKTMCQRTSTETLSKLCCSSNYKALLGLILTVHMVGEWRVS